MLTNSSSIRSCVSHMYHAVLAASCDVHIVVHLLRASNFKVILQLDHQAASQLG